MLKQKRLLLLSILLMFFAVSSPAQIADVSYPFSVECSENPLLAGETATFTGKFSPQAKSDSYTFNWTTTARTFTGQGTPRIVVKLPEDSSSITATLEIGGNSLWVGSQTTASCTVSIHQMPKAQLITETGHRSFDEMHTNYNLAEFESALRNDPSANGVIIYYGNKRAKREALNALRQIRKWSAPRFFDDRLTFVNGGERDKTLFQFYYVPAGASAPVPTEEPIDEKKFAELKANGNCEEMLSTLDGFYTKLQDNPTTTGYITIYGETGNTVKNFVRELRIKNHIAMRNVDSSRINISRGEMREDAATEFWIVPAGEEVPQMFSSQWIYKLPQKTKPFILGGIYSDGIDGCDGYAPKLYAEFLSANPHLRGNVVINETSPAKFRARQTEVLNELVKVNKIPRTRIKIVYVKVKPNRLQESTEFWLVPARR